MKYSFHGKPIRICFNNELTIRAWFKENAYSNLVCTAMFLSVLIKYYDNQTHIWVLIVFFMRFIPCCKLKNIQNFEANA